MRYYKNNTTGTKPPTLRRSQTITTFGVGAITDLPEASVIICGIDKWDIRGTIPLSDPRLEKKLAVTHFRMPPDAEGPGDGIRAIRFPRWMRCRNKRHNALMPLEAWEEAAKGTKRYPYFQEKPYCYLCSLTLVPSRFVVACRKGHLDDFPFVKWAHMNSEENKGGCKNPQLEYLERGSSAALSGIIIRCKSCGSSKTMAGSFSKETMGNVTTCEGAMPWEMTWKSQCGENVVTLQRGGTNVHFPLLKSSILIPPHTSDNIKNRIRSTHFWEAYESQENAADPGPLLQYIANELGESLQTVQEAVKDMLGSKDESAEADKTEEEYRYEEYRAFLGEFDAEKNDERDFMIEAKNADNYNLPFLKSVILVKKLRELRVQTGFSRIRPPQSSEEEGPVQADEKIEIMPVSQDRKTRWLPAYEVRGEGIFLELSPSELKKWAKTNEVLRHYNGLINRSRKHPDSFGIVKELSPEFVLLHTLSHVLIRQLSFECGYSSSALRERLYCSTESGKTMYGLLIYTAEGDSDGTLGGLVRQGEPDLFPATMMTAISEAQWCSSDPLCIESEGQGYQALNLGACHSCCMLPETSCELLNRYLDRASIIGTLNNHSVGLFSDTIKRLAAQLG